MVYASRSYFWYALFVVFDHYLLQLYTLMLRLCVNVVDDRASDFAFVELSNSFCILGVGTKHSRCARSKQSSIISLTWALAMRLA